jgi:hypothetical protein|tara:strand:+ start:766 stop:1161 length:396 start_codon:yes stop_codon:yes gene_type:complete
MTRSTGEWKLPELIDLKENDTWVAIPRIARTTPFGYKVDPENDHILRPIPRELDALKKAKEHLKQYSYRQVSHWLSKFTERPISHIGLMKRVKREQKRKNKARTLRVWGEYAEKAIQAAKKLEEERTSSRA